MILQIDKTKDVPEGVPTVMKSDFIDNVVRTKHVERGVEVHLEDGTVLSLEHDMSGRLAFYNYLADYSEYSIDQVYLLNDEGKTLKKLFD
ncbi:hypothetical protein [Enterococcus avium]|uniref:hypothetical protein n=1 Tax=Enterococcus avium TaxID=33945 RepID=UPI00289105EF|nr:hypothetical protein [Enterococcus avium]MDT2451049.1 hypothetical protein [Enterococcus avium]